MRLLLVVAAALVDTDGRVLIAQRPKGKAKVWTCDLTKEYVSINGDYRS